MLRAPMAPAAALMISIAATAGGCGEAGRSSVANASATEIAGVFDDLERATGERDYSTICYLLFSDELRERTGGAECPARLGRRARSVTRPRITIERIELRGDAASARVTTTADGQADVREVVELVREEGRFRIASLRR